MEHISFHNVLYYITLCKISCPNKYSNTNLYKSVLLHNDSTPPLNFILLAHSGLGPYAYFKDLYKLDLKDKIYLKYAKNIYEYEIEKIMLEAKTGKLYLANNLENKVVLITCTYQEKDKQTIYYADLKKIEKINDKG